MGIRERLRRQRQLEQEQQRMLTQQTVPEAIEEVTKKVVKEEPVVVKEVVVKEPMVVKEVVVEEPMVVKEVVVEEPIVIKEEPVVVKEVVGEEPEEMKLTNGKYKLSGIYKEGLQLKFNEFMIKPTQSYLAYGNKRIKGANNPFMALLNQPYHLTITVDSYLFTIQMGKTILKEKMSSPIIVECNRTPVQGRISTNRCW